MTRVDYDELIRAVRELRDLGCDVITFGVNRFEFPRAAPRAPQRSEAGGTKPPKDRDPDAERAAWRRKVMGDPEET